MPEENRQNNPANSSLQSDRQPLTSEQLQEFQKIGVGGLANQGKESEIKLTSGSDVINGTPEELSKKINVKQEINQNTPLNKPFEDNPELDESNLVKINKKKSFDDENFKPKEGRIVETPQSIIQKKETPQKHNFIDPEKDGRNYGAGNARLSDLYSGMNKDKNNLKSEADKQPEVFISTDNPTPVEERKVEKPVEEEKTIEERLTALENHNKDMLNQYRDILNLLNEIKTNQAESVNNIVINQAETKKSRSKTSGESKTPKSSGTTPAQQGSVTQPVTTTDPNLLRRLEAAEAYIAEHKKADAEREQKEKDRNRRIKAVVLGVALGVGAVIALPAATVSALALGSFVGIAGGKIGTKIMEKSKDEAMSVIENYKIALRNPNLNASEIGRFSREIEEWEKKLKKRDKWRTIFDSITYFSTGFAASTIITTAIKEYAFANASQAAAQAGAAPQPNVVPQETIVPNIHETVGQNFVDYDSISRIPLSDLGFSIEGKTNLLLGRELGGTHGVIQRELLKGIQTAGFKPSASIQNEFFRLVGEIYNNRINVNQAVQILKGI